jgi:vitamin B12 transporter
MTTIIRSVLSSSRSRGVELIGRFSLSDAFDLNANYSYNDTERPNGLPRQRRPEQLANLGLSWQSLNDKLNANAFYRISRDSYDGSGAVMTALDDFAVLDLSVNYSPTGNITVYGRVENALDERCRQVISYNNTAAALYVGIRFGLRE